MACQDNKERKIKLSYTSSSQGNEIQTSSTVLRITPEDQRSIAILFFANETNDLNLDWLKRGLSDMLVTELTQSPYIDVIPINLLLETVQKLGKSNGDLDNISLVAQAARQLNAERILSGKFYKMDSRLFITVDIIDASNVQIVHRETVYDSGLERIFAMVDELSKRVRNNLKDDMADRSYSAVNLEQMTKSLEAFKCYSEALENTEKFLFEEAEKCLEDAIAADSSFALAYLRLADVKLYFKKRDEAEKAIAKTYQFIDKLSETNKIILKLVEANLKEEFRKHLPLLVQALNLSPSDIELRKYLGSYYRAIGNTDKALEEFEIALDLSPNNKTIYNELGYVYAHRGDFNTALKYIDRYQELAPDEPNPYDSKGEILILAGQLYDAVHQLEMALEKWPKFYYSTHRLSELYAELGNYKKAMQYAEILSSSASQKSGKMDIDLLKAMIYWKFGNIKEAENHFNRSIKNNPYVAYPILLLGEMYHSIGDINSANSLYKKHLISFKAEIENVYDNIKLYRNFLAFLLETDFSLYEVVPILEDMISTQKDSTVMTDIKVTIGVLCARNGKYEKAVSYFEDSALNLVEMIAEYNLTGWSRSWKYFSEALANAPKNNPMGEKFSELLMKKADELNRKDLEYIVHFIRGQSYANSEKFTDLEKEYKLLGAPLEELWYVTGPLPQREFSGFLHEYPPEKDINISASYQVGEKEFVWKAAKDGAYDGYVNLKSIFQPSAWAVAYGLIYISSPDERKVQIRLGSDETCKLWLNDDLIWQHFIKQDARIDRDLVTVVLHPGMNKLLLKVTNTDLEWGYYLRITDLEGNGITDIKFHSAAEIKQSLASL